MNRGHINRLRGYSVRDCGGNDGLGGDTGATEEKGFSAAARRFRRESPEILYWSASVGFGLFAAFRIVGFIQ